MHGRGLAAPCAAYYLIAAVEHDLETYKPYVLPSADVYVLLGDIGMEEERFDSSATDYESALKLLMQKLEVRFPGTHLHKHRIHLRSGCIC